MAYKDFSKSYLDWLQSQLDYINGKPYINFSVSIDPTYEITAFKQAINIKQQNVFHNAADDQVAHIRALTEIDKTPSDYLAEYETCVNSDIKFIQAMSQEIESIHQIQDSSDKSTLQFYSTFAPKVLDDLARYNPMRIFEQ